MHNCVKKVNNKNIKKQLTLYFTDDRIIFVLEMRTNSYENSEKTSEKVVDKEKQL